MNFEDYLGEKHAEQYTGLDDEMSDDFVDWMEQLDNQELIDYADEYIKKVKEDINKSFNDVILPVEVPKDEYKKVTDYLITIGFKL